jgi:hypothetical protein
VSKSTTTSSTSTTAAREDVFLLRFFFCKCGILPLAVGLVLGRRDVANPSSAESERPNMPWEKLHVFKSGIVRAKRSFASVVGSLKAEAVGLRLIRESAEKNQGIREI